MSHPISLKEAERSVFRAAYNDGLWDIFLGCFFLMFVIAPYLSPTLGDFWSSAVFLPFWGLVFLALWMVRKNVVLPRIGRVTFGPARRRRLTRFSWIMLAANILAFILGLAAAASFGRVPGQLTTILFGLILLVLFSTAAYFLDFTRLYVYGLLVGLAPLAGEWLYSAVNAPHHGFPITFGAASTVMIMVGFTHFVRLLRSHPVSPDEATAGEA